MFELTHKQKMLRMAAASPAVHILAYGGSRSGKTFGFTYCVATRAISAPQSRHLITRHHSIDVRQAVLMDTWPSMMKLAYPKIDYQVNKSDGFVQFENEAEVWFAGLDDKERVEKILGKEYATIYPNECSQIPYENILTLRTRLAQKVNKVDGTPLRLKGYYDLNPVGKSHWTYREFVEGVRPDTRLPLPPESRTWVQLNPHDNMMNLAEGYIEELNSMPERQRQRFLDGKYLSEVPGTLWPLDRIDGLRIRKEQVPELYRIVVSVDPSGSDGSGGDSQGIIVAAVGIDGHGYILEDLSCRLSPAGWGERAVQAYHRWGADIIVAEANYGGAMVESTIRTADRNANVKLVNASRGKHVRAEPIAALYEERPGKPANAHHVGQMVDLEDQMGAFTTEGYQGSGSPDRADALVWALTELMLEDEVKVGVLLSSKNR